MLWTPTLLLALGAKVRHADLILLGALPEILLLLDVVRSILEHEWCVR